MRPQGRPHAAPWSSRTSWRRCGPPASSWWAWLLDAPSGEELLLVAVATEPVGGQVALLVEGELADVGLSERAGDEVVALLDLLTRDELHHGVGELPALEQHWGSEVAGLL